MARSTLPPLSLVGPDGGRLTLRALDHDDTVGTLADQLCVESLWTTRRVLGRHERLAEIDELRIGARLATSDPSLPAVGSDVGDSSTGVHVAVTAGPSCARWIWLQPGRHLIGRSPHATVRLDDPSIEEHQALVIVATDGDVQFVQLTGNVPARVDGSTLDRTVIDAANTRLRIGSSTLDFRIGSSSAEDIRCARGGGSVAEHPTDPWRRIVWRAPSDATAWAADAITAPLQPTEPKRPSATGLIGTGVTALGATGIALAMGNPMFLMFAAMGVVATLTTFAVGVGSARRARRRVRADHEASVDAFHVAIAELHRQRVVHHRATHRGLVETMTEALDGGSRLWQRRTTDPLSAVIGTGLHRWTPSIEIADRGALDPTVMQQVEQCARLDDTAAPISLAPGDAVAVHGSIALGRSVARSIISQLATWVGPADWQLVVVTSDRRRWRWADWLPHGGLDGASVVASDTDSFAERLDAIDTDRVTLLVTDEPHLFTSRTGPLRRFLSASGAASLVVVDSDATVPALCRRVLRLGATGSATWAGDVPESDDSVNIELVGLSLEAADEVARRLACLVDPEDDGGSGGGVPSSVTLGELLPAMSADDVLERWDAGGDDPAPVAPLGVSVDGRIDIDLVRDGPHGLIAGTTGAGKSELLRTLVVSMAASVAPEHVNFVLVDYKGGSTFDACTALPHTVGLVTDLDDGLAARALISLDAELHRRERLLRGIGAADLTDYRSRRDEHGAPHAPIARLVVVIDEFAALAQELPEFLAALVGIAQRGRSLGVHLLLATQRPAGVVNDDIRANTNLRLALRLHDRPDAIDVVGDELPAKFPRGLPGRSALRLGPDELVVFQAARCTGPVAATRDQMIVDAERAPTGRPHDQARPDEVPSELDAAVAAIVEAANRRGHDAPHRPWVEPLPFPLQLDGSVPLGGDDAAEDDDALGSDGAVGDDDVAGNDGAVKREAAASTAGTPIGLIDDPEHQRQRALTWQPGDGSLALIGSIGSGTTSILIALAAATCGATRVRDLHLYVIDARGDDGLGALATLAHCEGVVRLTEDERLHRLLARVVDAIDRRMAGTADESEIVVMIDGYGSLRNALGAIERAATFDLLLRLVNDGPAAGIALVLADDAGTAATSVAVTHRWIFYLDDPSAARGLGLRAAPVSHGTPGRFRVLATGLEGQVAQGAPGLASLPTHDEEVNGPQRIVALPELVDVDDLDDTNGRAESGDGLALPIGLGGDDLATEWLHVPVGDHVVVIGGPRTGVTNTLERCVDTWSAACTARGRSPRVVRVGRRQPLPDDIIDVISDGAGDGTGGGDGTGDGDAQPLAIVVDDAHRIDDDSGLLMKIAQGEFPHVTLIVGARADGVRSAYGHWTREAAKCRCGIVMATRGDPDGDLLGVLVPRRPLIPARPGLGWIVDGDSLRQVQVAHLA